jgi:hypothetical protein
LKKLENILIYCARLQVNLDPVEIGWRLTDYLPVYGILPFLNWLSI